MAQVNLTLNQDELLHIFSSGNSSEALRELLRSSMNQFMLAESEEKLNAEPYERSENRTDYRSGTSHSIQCSLKTISAARRL